MFSQPINHVSYGNRKRVAAAAWPKLTFIRRVTKCSPVKCKYICSHDGRYSQKVVNGTRIYDRSMIFQKRVAYMLCKIGG